MVSLARTSSKHLALRGGATTPYPVLNQDLVHLANVAYTRAFTANVLNEFRVVAQRLESLPSCTDEEAADSSRTRMALRRMIQRAAAAFLL